MVTAILALLDVLITLWFVFTYIGMNNRILDLQRQILILDERARRQHESIQQIADVSSTVAEAVDYLLVKDGTPQGVFMGEGGNA
jgi:hypothetical protein